MAFHSTALLPDFRWKRPKRQRESAGGTTQIYKRQCGLLHQHFSIFSILHAPWANFSHFPLIVLLPSGALEMKCYRKVLHISYKDHVTNEEVRAKIQQAIGPHEDLLTVVKRRKLQWYGHVSRSSGLAKTILQGTVKGGRRQGRQKKSWEDNVIKWTGLECGKSQRAVENWENGENWLQNLL